MVYQLLKLTPFNFLALFVIEPALRVAFGTLITHNCGIVAFIIDTQRKTLFVTFAK